MSLLGYVICILRGKHTWSRWMNPEDDICQISRSCTTCPKVEHDKSHDFSEWEYQFKDICVQSRKCQRSGCEMFDVRTEHESFQPFLIEESPCDIVEKCSRCGKRHHVETRHAFEHGKCVHCGYVEPIILCEEEDWVNCSHTLSGYPF